MGFNTPSIMYEAGLHGPDFDVAGSTVAGYPFIMFGRNREGAFTSTAGIDNCIQMFVESITATENGPDTYTFRGEEFPVETDEETINVAGAENMTYTQRFTRHGVVTQWNPDEGEAIAQTRSYAGRHMNCWRAYYESQFAADAEEYDGEPSAWRKSVRIEKFDNMALFGMPIGVTQAGEMAWVNRGTENHFVRLNDDPTAENVLPPGNDGYVAPDGSTTDDYADQLGLFKDFEYKRLLYDDSAVAAATRSTRTLARDRPAAVPESDTTYYQVDFVVGEPIEELRGPEGTYTNDQLLRFLHGSTDEPVTRRSAGEFVTDDAVADRIATHPIEVANGTARTTFTVAVDEPVTLTLVSYEKTGPGWSPATESEQVFIDSETQTFESGTHTLTVGLPR